MSANEPFPALSWPTGPADAAPADRSAEIELASHLAGRLCHDMISPASAIVSGLDLLEDPSAADMREDAERLIADSAKKLVALLAFSRVAFGGSSGAEVFDVRDLERLVRGVFAYVRAELDWDVSIPSLTKPAAKALLNLAQIGAGALPTGGVARVFAEAGEGEVLLGVDCRGTRARLRPEVTTGLGGAPLTEGLSGHWIQAYFLYATLRAAGGRLDYTAVEERVILRARVPV
jgi:histidine phosphotransferase ChpT